MGQAEKSSRCRPGSSARLRSLYRRLRHSRSESGEGASPKRTSNFSSIKRKEFPLTSAPGRAAVSSGLPTGSHPLNANSGRKANEIRDGTACRLRKGRDPQTVGAVREVRADRSRRRQRDDTSLAAPPHKIRPIRLIGTLRRRGARGARELGRALADFHNVERQRGQRFGHSLTCLKTHKNRRFCGLPAPAIIGITEPCRPWLSWVGLHCLWGGRKAVGALPIPSLTESPNSTSCICVSNDRKMWYLAAIRFRIG